MDAQGWMRHIVPAMAGLSGGHRYQHLEGALEKLDPEALSQLHRFLQDVEQQMIQAKRTVQMWPGGPRIRM